MKENSNSKKRISLKRSSDTSGNDAFKISERNKNTLSKLSSQYATFKNAVKGEEEVQDDTDQSYGFVDEFLEKALNTSNIYEAQQDTAYDFWISDHNVHTSISINNTLYMNLLFLPENHHISILDGGADQGLVKLYFNYTTPTQRPAASSSTFPFTTCVFLGHCEV
jgi:hypothetical protein